jgi:C1A family cysteine protease
MSEPTEQRLGMGYIPDLADFRDYSKEDVPDIYNKLNLETVDENIVIKNDFSSMFTAVRSQGSLGSCTAFASAGGIVEFYNKNVHGDTTQLSTLFQYKLTRDEMGVKGDVGAYMRSAMQALVNYGTVLEKDYPYTTDLNKFDLDPSVNLKVKATNRQALTYVRIDQRNVTTTDVLKELRRHSAKNIPIMIGFSVYDNSWKQANSYNSEGAFPFPAKIDRIVGGHAVTIAGHDDTKVITNKQDSVKTIGAFKIRNSWGVNWGLKGYGWLPYKYIEQQLAMDFWALLSMEYVDQRKFN